METESIKTVIVQLGELVVLSALVCLSLYLRHRSAWRQLREEEVRAKEFRRCWRPTRLDASSIKGQVDNLRRDYSLAVHDKSGWSDFHKRILASIRHAISQRAFFHQVPPDAPEREQEIHLPSA